MLSGAKHLCHVERSETSEILHSEDFVQNDKKVNYSECRNSITKRILAI